MLYRIYGKIKRSILTFRTKFIYIHKYGEFLEEGYYSYLNKSWHKCEKWKLGTIKKNQCLYDESFPPQSHVEFFSGTWSGKTIAVYDEFVVSYYDIRGKKWIKNIKESYSEIHYPKCNNLLLDENKLITICERVRGGGIFR